MNNETSKTSAPAAASPLTTKPDLVKNIGGTTFDIHIHFSETSRETFTDKVVRLIKNDSGDETAYKQDTFFLFLIDKTRREASSSSAEKCCKSSATASVS